MAVRVAVSTESAHPTYCRSHRARQGRLRQHEGGTHSVPRTDNSFGMATHHRKMTSSVQPTSLSTSVGASFVTFDALKPVCEGWEQSNGTGHTIQPLNTEHTTRRQATHVQPLQAG